MTAMRMQRPTIPRDERLPQIAQLLDRDVMISVLARSLGSDAHVSRIEIPYVRYRPGKTLEVHYVCEGDGVSQHAAAVASAIEDLSDRLQTRELLERAQLVQARSPGVRPVLFEPELESVIQVLPFDLELAALAEPPKTLRGRLEDAGLTFESSEGEPVLLQYRPCTRAALRLEGHVLKVYRRESDLVAGVAGFEATAGLRSLRTPRCEAVVPDLRLTSQEWLPGIPPTNRAEAARDAGALLAELHGTGLGHLPKVLPAHRLEKGAAAVKLVSAVAPWLAERAEALLRKLESSVPESRLLVPSHGDFHGGQLLRVGDDYAVLDFDLLCAAPPALDLANYAGHLAAQESRDLGAAVAVLEELVAGYGSRPPDLPWYLSAVLLWFTRGPFKRFEDGWPERMETTLGAAEAALSFNL